MWNIFFDKTGKKARCKLCQRENEEVSSTLNVCLSCIRKKPDESIEITKDAHRKIRETFDLPPDPPSSQDGIGCNVCANECKIGLGEKGYCGLRKNIDGKLRIREGVLHTYYDPLPTNCCASWFCGATLGYNLAVFPYACSFNCVFCQNSEHKNITTPEEVEIGSLVRESEKASCICYFGGTPEPQLPFLLRATEKIVEKNKRIRICWEWNGTGNPKLVKKAAGFSYDTHGTVKFDLKAFDCNLNIALTGRPNHRTLDNFRMINEEFKKKDLLTATTLLVPGYIDEEEVEKIARFISSVDRDIPYSLLAFHPDFKMMDMPVTTRRLAEGCYRVARKYLNRVNIGNKHLLW
jgi:pyruvate formate lyase activating enzyme